MTAPAPAAGGPQAPPAPAPLPTTPRRQSFGGFGALAVAGLAAIGAGVTALVMHNGTYDASTGAMAWAVALAIISAALVVGGIAGRRAGVLGLLVVIVALCTVVAALIPKMSNIQSSGDRTWRPLSVSAASDGYGLGAGDAVLDLTNLDVSGLSTASPIHVPASVAFGQLRVRVPSDLSVEVKSSAGVGNLVGVTSDATASDSVDQGALLANENDLGDVNGVGVHRTTYLGTGPVQIVIDAKVGFGQVNIEQVPR